MKRFFYLHHWHAVRKPFLDPKTHSKATRTEYVCNAQKRDGFIRKFGKAEFDRVSAADEEWGRLRDIPFPKGTNWLFDHFYRIWTGCAADFSGSKILTPRQILDYCECFGVRLTYRERGLIMRMRHWAFEAISEMDKD